MKTGWKTTEFWSAVVSQIVGLLIVLGILTPDIADVFKDATAQIVGGIIMAVSGVGYAISRGLAKLKG